MTQTAIQPDQKSQARGAWKSALLLALVTIVATVWLRIRLREYFSQPEQVTAADFPQWLARPEQITAAVIYFGGVALVGMLLVLLFSFIFNKRLFAVFSLAQPALPAAFKGLAWGLALVLTPTVLLWLAGVFSWPLHPWAPSPGWSYLAGTLLMFVLLAVAEEMVFRGYILGNLLRAQPLLDALLLTGMIYAVSITQMVKITPLAFVNFYIYSLLSGLFMVGSGLWAAIGLRSGLYLALAASGVYLGNSQFGWGGALAENVSNFFTGGSYGLFGSLLQTPFLLAAFFYFYKKRPMP